MGRPLKDLFIVIEICCYLLCPFRMRLVLHLLFSHEQKAYINNINITDLSYDALKLGYPMAEKGSIILVLLSVRWGRKHRWFRPISSEEQPLTWVIDLINT